MNVITLTTEWRPNDIYPAILKGKLCSLCPETMIIDNAFNISPYDIPTAAFIVSNSYMNYPPGSIHIICVRTEASNHQKYIAVRLHGHYFITTDNGIISLILHMDPNPGTGTCEEAVFITPSEDYNELESYAEIASSITGGKTLSEIGTPVNNMYEITPYRATIENNLILGSVIFIDSYGNVFTNITKKLFNNVFKDKKINITIKSYNYSTNKIVSRYCDVNESELLARFNSFGLLEIAINGDNISELLGVSINSTVRVEHNIEKKKSNDTLF